MHRCISFKFWSSVLSKSFVWFFLEWSSGSLSIPRDKRSSGHLCSSMTRANGQSGPRAPEQMFTSVSLCKRKLREPQIKNLMKTLLLLIWRGVPEGRGDSFEVTLLDAEWTSKSYVLGQTWGSLQPFYFQFLISPIDPWDAFWSLYCLFIDCWHYYILAFTLDLGLPWSVSFVFQDSHW